MPEVYVEAMDFDAVVRRRRMTRRFAPTPVPPETIERLVRTGLRGPSAGFSQGIDLLVLDGDQTQEYWAATTDGGTPDGWLAGVSAAPLLILCYADPERYLDRYAEPDKGWSDRDLDRWPIPYWDVDTGMAALLVMLAAVDAGLGTLFFGCPADRHAAVARAFGVPPDRRLIGVVAVGEPLPSPRSPSLARGRRTDAVHRGRFGVHG